MAALPDALSHAGDGFFNTVELQKDQLYPVTRCPPRAERIWRKYARPDSVVSKEKL